VTARFLVEPLKPAHERHAFDSGIAALDRYFRERVTQDVRRRVTSCFVAVDPAGVVAGYYTLAAASLPLSELPAAESRRLPRYPLLPAALVGRLAVDRRFQRQGLGSGLIVDAITKALSAEPAIYTLLVDAKDASAHEFYRHLGFRPFASRPLSLFLPLAEAARRMSALTGSASSSDAR
jgi:GNAT superfamily N-acetyltransferase